MGRLRSFLRCSPRERHLLLKAAFLTAAIRVGLLFLPFRTVSLLVARNARPRSKPGSPAPDRDQLVWAVCRAQAHVPGRRTCLQEALVGQLMLARAGFPVRSRIGVKKGERGELQAHAWIEVNDDIVIGGPLTKVRTFTALHDLEDLKLLS